MREYRHPARSADSGNSFVEADALPVEEIGPVLREIPVERLLPVLDHLRLDQKLRKMGAADGSPAGYGLHPFEVDIDSPLFHFFRDFTVAVLPVIVKLNQKAHQIGIAVRQAESQEVALPRLPFDIEFDSRQKPEWAGQSGRSGRGFFVTGYGIMVGQSHDRDALFEGVPDQIRR